MSTAATVTTNDILSMPENGMDRWLIAGEIRERPMTIRNRFHSRITAKLCVLPGQWLERQKDFKGILYNGEVGVRLSRDPDTTVGIDIAVFSKYVIDQQAANSTIIDGVPLLAVEVLSPSDSTQEIHEKIEAYLEAQVKAVWIINPYDKTVRIYSPDSSPESVNELQELSGEKALPGFRVAVKSIFE